MEKRHPGDGGRLHWRIRPLGEDLYIIRGSDLRNGEPTLAPPNWKVIDQWCAEPIDRVSLEQAHQKTGLPWGLSGGDWLARDLERAFRMGILAIIEWAPPRKRSTGDEGPSEFAAAAAAAGRAAVRAEKTWIEIELVDDKDKPVAAAKYWIKLTDGSERTGSLNSEGRVRISGIDPGTCLVRFPDYDGKDWD